MQAVVAQEGELELVGGVAEEGMAEHVCCFSVHAGSSSNGGTPAFAQASRIPSARD